MARKYITWRDIPEAIAWLRTAVQMINETEEEIAETNEAILRIRDRMLKVTGKYGDDPTGRGKRMDYMDAVAEIGKKEDKLSRLRDRQAMQKGRLETKLMRRLDREEYRIIWGRFIEHLTLEQMARELHYDRVTVWRINQRVFEKLIRCAYKKGDKMRS